MLLSMDEFRAFEPKKTTYALFGWPLGHTMSPELHAQLFEAAGQDADYIGVAVPPEDLPEAFELAKRKLGGINCTIPHKKAEKSQKTNSISQIVLFTPTSPWDDNYYTPVLHGCPAVAHKLVWKKCPRAPSWSGCP